MALRVVGALVAAAVVATVLEVAGRTTVNPFNLFGYFTIQSNIILAVVLVVAGVGLLRRRLPGDGLVLARAAATTYIVIVGLVYVTLLAPLGAAGGVPIPWANTVLHIVTPIAAVGVYVLLILVVFLVVGAGVLRSSRLRTVVPATGTMPGTTPGTTPGTMPG